MSIQFENINNIYFFLLILFCVLLFQYKKLLSNKNNIYKRLLLTIRSFILFLIIMLLFNPTLLVKTIVSQDKHVNIFIDNSQSIKKNIELNNIEIEKVYNNIINWSIDNNIELKYFLFGQGAEGSKRCPTLHAWPLGHYIPGAS